MDTNVVVRYLTGEPPDLARRAGEIVDSDVPLLVTDVVLVETAYVLTSFYRVPREVVVDHLIAFVQRQNVAVAWLDKGIVIQGLLLCRPSGRVSFADALVWAAARSAHAGIVYSFDERFPADGIEVRRER
ncbi:MAG: PIN domain-containing protein [Chloroflexi bacterium]|nr:PIN domain-containing protein [Chloroflexota bacterium]